MMDKTFCKSTHRGAAEHLRQKRKKTVFETSVCPFEDKILLMPW